MVRIVPEQVKDVLYPAGSYRIRMGRDEPYERLQRARRAAGYQGPGEAAAAFGWNVNTYKSHENGLRGLRRPTAERYARAFHVSAAWLLTGEGDQDERATPPERELLTKYRSLPEAGRRIVSEVCDLLGQGLNVRIASPTPREKGGDNPSISAKRPAKKLATR